MELSSIKELPFSIEPNELLTSKSKVGRDSLSSNKKVINKEIKSKFNEIRDQFCRKEYRESGRSLNNEELDTFRTVLCSDHINSKCLDPESCFDSHCSAWQRRNPSKFMYSSTICPDIDFSRKGNKGRMSLSCRCKKGRLCEFAHTKEEELYHPEVYKTKKCNSYPNCKRYYCPFIHKDKELSNRDDFQNTLKTKNSDFVESEFIYEKKDDETSENNEIIDKNIYKHISNSKKMSFDENKQEALMMLLNCQKLILEGNYYLAKQIIKKLLLITSRLCESEQFANIISLNLWSSPIYYPNYLINSEKNDRNIGCNSSESSFNFFMDIDKFNENNQDLIVKTDI